METNIYPISKDAINFILEHKQDDGGKYSTKIIVINKDNKVAAINCGIQYALDQLSFYKTTRVNKVTYHVSYNAPIYYLDGDELKKLDLNK